MSRVKRVLDVQHAHAIAKETFDLDRPQQLSDALQHVVRPERALANVQHVLIRGATTGRFIENVDFRATKADPRDPAIQPDMKPLAQHEFVGGGDWAITPNWSLETRYSRKRLDNAIEDMSITDNLGFYIGNPGSTFSNVLHRPVSIPCSPTPGFTCTAERSSFS